GKGRKVCRQSGTKKVVSISGSRSQRAEGHGKGDWKTCAGYQILQYGCISDCGLRCSCIASWDGRAAGMGTLWSVGIRRRRPECDCRSRSRVWAPASGRTNVSDDMPRVGMDSITASGDLYGRKDEALPSMVNREKL